MKRLIAAPAIFILLMLNPCSGFSDSVDVHGKDTYEESSKTKNKNVTINCQVFSKLKFSNQIRLIVKHFRSLSFSTR